MRRSGIFRFLVIPAVMIAFAAPFTVAAHPADEQAVQFFYSESCPHCHKAHNFFDRLSEQYSSVRIKRYNIAHTQHHEMLRQRAAETGAERYLGVVPLTFIGDSYVAGFDTPETTGREIERTLHREFDIEHASSTPTKKEEGRGPPSVFGVSVDPDQMSLPAIAVLLGILDGFNVCSLGALVLILGLILTLRSRAKIALYGGAFVITTAIIYGALIVLWHQLFSLLAPYVVVMEVLLAALGIGGGIYFLQEYWRFRRQGVTCSANESPFVSSVSRWVQRIFERRSSVLGLAAAVVAFGAVITIVEFPCSAAVPVMFAGILANAELSAASYLLYIALFVLFYLLDELIIFGIAVCKLHLWMASPTFTIWAALIEGAALTSLGIWYAASVVNALL